MKKISVTIVAIVAAVTFPALGSSVQATNVGNEGCTPGYWKNHTDNWWEDDANTVRSYETTDTFGWVFGVDSDTTLLEALQGGGGKGVAGAQKILARAATAAVLNAAHEGLGYPLRRDAFGSDAGIIADVAEAWNSGDRGTILALATELDDLNNLGCPLN